MILAEEPWRTFGREFLTGAYRDSLNNAHYDGPKSIATYHLFAVDGEPHTVKFGLKQPGYTCKKVREIVRRGGEIEHRQQLAPELHLDAEHALSLLDRFGYGLAPRRYRNRNAESREEKDCFGKMVKRVDDWIWVEKGSRFAQQAAEEIAREHADDRKRLEWALRFAPGNPAIEAALGAIAQRKAAAREARAAG